MDTQNPQEGATPEASVSPQPEMGGAAPEPQPVTNNESKFPTSAVVGIVVLVAAVIGALYYFTPSGFPFLSEDKGAFNIPKNGEHLLLFDNGVLYALDLENAQTTELGVFNNGEEINTAVEAALSSDRSHIALAVPRDRGGNDITAFTDFMDYRDVISQSGNLQSVAVSNSGSLLFSETTSGSTKVYFAPLVSGNGVESLGVGETPFFADGGDRIVIGTDDGFKMLDLTSGDSLESETPDVPLASRVNPSSNDEYLALISQTGVAYLFDMLSSRPVRFVENSAFPFPGIKDVEVSSGGKVALLRDVEGQMLVTVFNTPNSAMSYTISLDRDSLLVGWNK